MRTHPDNKLLKQHRNKSAAALLQLVAFLRVYNLRQNWLTVFSSIQNVHTFCPGKATSGFIVMAIFAKA